MTPEPPSRPPADGLVAAPPLDPATTIVAALDRLARAQRRHRQAVASASGLTVLQVELLLCLAGGVGASPSVGTLAREVGVSQPTATDSLRALVAKGLVVLAPGARDRRRRVAALTTQGRRLVAEVARADEAVRAVVAGLDPRDQDATLTALLGIIARFVEAGLIEVARTCLTCRFHRVSDAGAHHCTLLRSDLAPGQLRVDCPEHVPA